MGEEVQDEADVTLVIRRPGDVEWLTLRLNLGGVGKEEVLRCRKLNASVVFGVTGGAVGIFLVVVAVTLCSAVL